MQGINENLIQAFIAREQLPADFVDTIRTWYLPLADRLLTLSGNNDLPLIVGINGAQGTGKSTLANLLALILQQHNLRVANLSLDDFYLDRSSRRELASKTHPLLATRGVPGTHNLELMRETFTKLGNPASQGSLALPRFDKATDNPRPTSDWASIELPVDIIVLEGWFVGLVPEAEEALPVAVNKLETEEDKQGKWRRYVNNCLLDFQPLFETIDLLIMLKAPSFDCVYQWRSLQEQKLADNTNSADNKVMDAQALQRFIQHFERLTRHCLKTLPSRADMVFHLDEHHGITHMSQAVH